MDKKERNREYQRKKLLSEENRKIQRERTRKSYWKRKEKKRLEEERRKALQATLPRPEFYDTDCCLICSHFSKAGGLPTGWCLKTKRGTDKKDICGFFDPVQKDEEYIWIIEGSR